MAQNPDSISIHDIATTTPTPDALAGGPVVPGGGAYLSCISAMCGRYPNLRMLDGLLKSPYLRSGRAAVLEFRHPDDRVEFREFKSAEDLQAYLIHTPSVDCCRRLYMLEDISPPFADVLGGHLQIDPAAFACQLNTANWYGDPVIGNPPKLPSSCDPREFFTVLYYEMRFIVREIAAYELFSDSNVYRKIGVTRGPDSLDSVALAHRNATYWSKTNGRAGWDVVFLLDPPVGDTLQTPSGTLWQPNHPYQGGYVDFSPCPSMSEKPHLAASNGPSRSSALDDIAFYWTRTASKEQIRRACGDPSQTTIFLKKMVASHWIIMTQYLKTRLSQLEYSLERGAKSPITLERLESTLNTLHTWRRRCAQYCEQMDMNILSLGIPLDGISTECPPSSDNGTAKDFLFIRHVLISWRSRMESLMPVVMGLTTIHEGKRISRLTVLGAVFIPLSFTSGLLSMGGDFTPGGPRFWIFFVICIPILAAVVAMAFNIRENSLRKYNELTARWRQ